MAFGTSDAHIHQPPFFFHVAFFNAVGVRQHTFFTADQKYIRVFQPFGGVQGREFDGIDFEQDSESCTCIIYRKDRSHPIKVTEWMAECKRGTGPWQSHPRRMLRHKAMIQGARLAFGYGGIYDQDEAERIVEAQPVKHMGAADVVAPPPATYNEEKFNANIAKWAETISTGRKSAADYIAFAQTRGEPFTEEQKARLLSVKKAPASQTDVQDVQPKDALNEGAPAVTYADVAGKLRGALDMDALDDAASLIGAVENQEHRRELSAIYDQCASALNGSGE